MTDLENPGWLREIRWNSDGLVPVIAQDKGSGRVLTLAWMNDTALAKTAEQGRAIYWSRSRQKLWHKGEESGHIQWIDEIRLDCDKDAVLLSVKQEGGIACHTGRESCFFTKLDNSTWREIDPVLKDPNDIYKTKK